MNAWKNKETWIVSRYLSYNESLYEGLKELLWGWPPRGRTVEDLAKLLRSLVEEHCPALQAGGLEAELLQEALDRVDWKELAASRIAVRL